DHAPGSAGDVRIGRVLLEQAVDLGKGALELRAAVGIGKAGRSRLVDRRRLLREKTGENKDERRDHDAAPSQNASGLHSNSLRGGVCSGPTRPSAMSAAK